MRPAKNCINLKAFFIFNGVFALLTDLIVLLLPIPLIYTLNPARHQKVAMVPLFALGTFIVVISTQRLFFLVTSKPGKDDLTYDLLSTLWTIVEYNLGICCACAPIVRVFALKVWAGVDSSTRGDGGLRVMNSSDGGRGRCRSGSSRGYRDGKDDDEFDLADAHNTSGRKGSYASYSTSQTDGSDTRGRGHDRSGSSASGFGYAYAIEGGNGYSQAKKGSRKERSKSKENKTIRIGPRYLYYSRSRSTGRSNSTNNTQPALKTRAATRRVTDRGRSDSSSDSEVRLILQTPEPLVSPMPSTGGGGGGDDIDFDGHRGGYRHRGRRSSGAGRMIRLERTVSPMYASSYDVEGDYRAQGLR